MKNQPGLALSDNQYENVLRLAAASRFMRRYGVGKLCIARYDAALTEFKLVA